MNKLHAWIDVRYVIRQSGVSSSWLLLRIPWWLAQHDWEHVQSHRSPEVRDMRDSTLNHHPGILFRLDGRAFTTKRLVMSNEAHQIWKSWRCKFGIGLKKSHFQVPCSTFEASWLKKADLIFCLFGWVVQLPTTVAFDSIFCFHLLILGREPYSFGHWNLPDSCAKDLEMPFMPESNMVPWQSWQCLAGRGIRSC